VSVGILAQERWSVTHVAVRPADGEFGALQGFDPALERVLAAGAKSHVPHSRLFGCCELQSVALVIIPGAEIDRIAIPAAFGHPHDVDEEADTFFWFRSENLQVPQMGDIGNGFVLHAN